jgi:hypothetical protein
VDYVGDVGIILEQITQLARSDGKVFRHLCKEVEELGFAWQEADHNGAAIS